MSAQATRLSSLLLLVRDGSSAQIRENAAEKLGQVATQSSESCHSILQQIRPLIVDQDWDIRVAASKCVDVVAHSLRNEDENVADLFAAVSLGSREASCMTLNLQSVDIAKVVQEGAPLLRSGGEEYQYATNLSEDERRIHAVKQRRLLLQRLSGAAGPIWKTREDTLTKQLLPRLNRDHAQEIADDIEASEAEPKVCKHIDMKNEQKQARDMLSISKRKRHPDRDADGGKSKLLKVDDHNETETALTSASLELGGKLETNLEGRSKITTVANLVTDLFESMFDSKWEVRHGSLLSLRQIFLSAHFTEAVEVTRTTSDESRQRNFIDKWLEECLVRCVCVLALDQFVDYSADGTVSLVREVCAQVFGILLGSLYSKDVLVRYLQVLQMLFSGSTWHARHGGLLGLRYLVRAHVSHAQVLVPLIFNDVMEAFTQPGAEEDVLILTADMFTDFTAYLQKVDTAKITKVAVLLWKSLKNTENTGLVTASVVRVLSAWYNYPFVAAILKNDDDVKSVIWGHLAYAVPMLHHHSHVVRMSSATCIAAIFSSEFTLSDASPVEFARVFLPRLLLQLLLEQDASTQQSLINSWKEVVKNLSVNDLLMSVVAEQVPIWMELLWSTDSIGCLNVEVNNSALDIDLADRGWHGNVLSRVAFAEAIGFIAAHLSVASACMNKIVKLICDGISASCGERQCGALLALSQWGNFEKQLECYRTEDRSRRLQYLEDSFRPLLTSIAENRWHSHHPDAIFEGKPVFYTEQLGSMKRVAQMEARIISIFSSVGIALEPAERPNSSSTADISRTIAEHIALFPYEKLQAHLEEYEMTHFKRQDLFLVDELVQQGYARFYHRIQGLGSSAFCVLLPLPKKSGFLVKALMNSIKEEDEVVFRGILAQAIATFVVDQASSQKKCVAKMISNLCNSASALVGVSGGPFDGIVALSNVEDDELVSVSPDVVKKTKVRTGGAEAALRAICKTAAGALFGTCSALEDTISKAWSRPDVDGLTVQRCMHLVTLVVPHVETTAMPSCVLWLDRLAQLTQQPFNGARTKFAVAHAIATVCKHAQGLHRENAMLIVYKFVFVAFARSGNGGATTTEALEGAVMVLDRIVHTLGAELMSYVPSLVYYAMQTMSSQIKHVRTLAAGTFAELVPLIPLQMDLAMNESCQALPDSLQTIASQNAVSRSFLESFTKGKAVQRIDVTTWLAQGTSLRTYQQHGVDWMCFMAKNNLYGILADDMGLGKTLQTLSAIAATLQTAELVGSKQKLMPCLVVCPPIVVHHWIMEAQKYLPEFFGSIVDYSLPASDRKTLRCDGGIPLCGDRPTLIVTTYSILRSDIEHLSTIDYSFVVLDEAHLIRNPSTALFRAVLELHASHRVALSGTPLQNNVTDLWALFEFLMPGYLGDFALFRREFVLPITKSKERNATAKQKELAAIAITQLHQKVLPFILRRTKDQVLSELPPKIISNVLLPLSPLQKRLYSLASSTENEANNPASDKRSLTVHDTKQITNVFTNLQLLRKICVHPALVVDTAVAHKLSANEKRALDDWKSSGKMTGLRDLLVECCDIAAGDQSNNDGRAADTINADDCNISPHRCLVFAHLQKTLDLTEQMLCDALPRVTYRRLDGQTPHSKRQDIVQNFNADPSIDVLLLTTSVGGLGLTLTGADTVIFVEHSWNPFVDLQAMDRAHRIGQKRTVRVFRLIMEESLEEHILNLQEFKEKVAATVVKKNDARSSMNANTKGVLKLLQTSSSAVAAKEIRAMIGTKKANEADQQMAPVLPQGAQELLDQLGELWDESQYESLAFPEQTE